MTTPLEVAAHETGAVLRLQRLGWPGPAICHALRMSKQQLFHEVKRASDQECEAARNGLPIYPNGVPRC